VSRLAGDAPGAPDERITAVSHDAHDEQTEHESGPGGRARAGGCVCAALLRPFRRGAGGRAALLPPAAVRCPSNARSCTRNNRGQRTRGRCV
jgi:hypothetical protein